MAEILAILPTHGIIILTKFNGDWTKIVDFLLVVYFWASMIFFESVFTFIVVVSAIFIKIVLIIVAQFSPFLFIVIKFRPVLSTSVKPCLIIFFPVCLKSYSIVGR